MADPAAIPADRFGLLKRNTVPGSAVQLGGYTFFGFTRSGVYNFIRRVHDATGEWEEVRIADTSGGGVTDDHVEIKLAALSNGKLIATWSPHNGSATMVTYFNDPINNFTDAGHTHLTLGNGTQTSYNGTFQLGNYVLLWRRYADDWEYNTAPISDLSAWGSWRDLYVEPGGRTGYPAAVKQNGAAKDSNRLEMFFSTGHPDEGNVRERYLYLLMDGSGNLTAYHPYTDAQITMPFTSGAGFPIPHPDGAPITNFKPNVKADGRVVALYYRFPNGNGTDHRIHGITYDPVAETWTDRGDLFGISVGDISAWPNDEYYSGRFNPDPQSDDWYMCLKNYAGAATFEAFRVTLDPDDASVVSALQLTEDSEDYGFVNIRPAVVEDHTGHIVATWQRGIWSSQSIYDTSSVFVTSLYSDGPALPKNMRQLLGTVTTDSSLVTGTDGFEDATIRLGVDVAEAGLQADALDAMFSYDEAGEHFIPTRLVGVDSGIAYFDVVGPLLQGQDTVRYLWGAKSGETVIVSPSDCIYVGYNNFFAWGARGDQYAAVQDFSARNAGGNFDNVGIERSSWGTPYNAESFVADNRGRTVDSFENDLARAYLVPTLSLGDDWTLDVSFRHDKPGVQQSVVTIHDGTSVPNYPTRIASINPGAGNVRFRVFTSDDVTVEFGDASAPLADFNIATLFKRGRNLYKIVNGVVSGGDDLMPSDAKTGSYKIFVGNMGGGTGDYPGFTGIVNDVRLRSNSDPIEKALAEHNSLANPEAFATFAEVSTDADINGTASTIALSAIPGTVSTTATIQGATGFIAFSAIPGTVSSTTDVIGSNGFIAFSATPGTVSTNPIADINGVSSIIALIATPGSVASESSVIGGNSFIALSAVPGSITTDPVASIDGASGFIALSAVPGAVTSTSTLADTAAHIAIFGTPGLVTLPDLVGEVSNARTVAVLARGSRVVAVTARRSEMTKLELPFKRSGEVLNYAVDWSALFSEDETIVTSTFDNESGVTLDAQNNDDTTSTVILSGGTENETGSMTCTVTTSEGNTFIQPIEVPIY